MPNQQYDHVIRPPFQPAFPTLVLLLASFTPPYKRLLPPDHGNTYRSQDWNILPIATVPPEIILLNTVSPYLCPDLLVSDNMRIMCLSYYLLLLNAPLHKLRIILKLRDKCKIHLTVFHAYFILPKTMNIRKMFGLIQFQNDTPATDILEKKSKYPLKQKKRIPTDSCN